MGDQKNTVLKMYDDPRLIKAIKEWDICEFLSTNNINYKLGGKNIGRNYIGITPCPSCKETKFHAGIHKENKFLSCFVCKCSFGPLKIVSHYLKISIKNAFNYFIDSVEDDRPIDQRVIDILKYNNEKANNNNILLFPVDTLPQDAKLITKNNINNFYQIDKFIKKRKIKIWDLKRYKLYQHKADIIWPVYLNNIQVSYQKRKVMYKQYYIPPNLPKYIYGQNEIKINKPLILVEGFLDYVRIDTFIRNTEYKNKVSVTTGMIKSISKQQIKRLINCKPSKIIVMYDNDSWFDYWRVKKEVPFDVDYVILPKNTDPNELTWKQMEHIFKEEIIVS